LFRPFDALAVKVVPHYLHVRKPLSGNSSFLVCFAGEFFFLPFNTSCASLNNSLVMIGVCIPLASEFSSSFQDDI
jgi:hypothetical protein